ncbi:1-acyl-sn-glycerol-3-phosphate acyltransferase [Streptomyces sp. NBC_00102]|uniref:lysophospholipid acyltransferase family protein n=1 Tax=Streptomyces sp. NBC_00102 TaxID=2975652 RepID=UPI002254A762|nr:lysophospholipid acyltransferase family protein [Streptomyces sp. NBC_00102]MCX5402172.1 1-acyl-sn-glycerol-3-phosphate acyltransferase [Streptomyces sp. NBC_00102]
MNAWFPLSPCTPQACAGHHGAVRPLLPAVARLVAGCLLATGGAACTPLAAALTQPARDLLVRRWSRAVLRTFGVRMRVTGNPGDRGGGELVVANHISWLDIPLVAAALPARMLGKSEIRRWPLLGTLAARGGTLFIDRESLRALPESVGAVADALRAGDRVVAFPEGSTRCGGGPPGPFRHAVFQAALDAGATVRPARITYTLETAPAEDPGRDAGLPARAVAFVGDDPLSASLWRVVRAAGVTAELTLLPPLRAEGTGGRPDAAQGTGGRPDVNRRTPPGERRALARLAQTAVASDTANLSAESVHH